MRARLIVAFMSFISEMTPGALMSFFKALVLSSQANPNFGSAPGARLIPILIESQTAGTPHAVPEFVQINKIESIK
jgi:hypothetical protein